MKALILIPLAVQVFIPLHAKRKYPGLPYRRLWLLPLTIFVSSVSVGAGIAASAAIVLWWAAGIFSTRR
jgi:hypothetical protein